MTPPVEALGACPFCGSAGKLAQTFDDDWIVHCVKHDCKGNVAYFDAAAEAIAAWNRRPDAGAEMREACAKVADADAAEAKHDTATHGRSAYGDAWQSAGERIARRIRALSTPSPEVGLTDAGVGAWCREAIRDDVMDLLTKLHWEAWKAGVFTSQEEWPDEEEQGDLTRAIDSVAVGEHFDAWGRETVEKLTDRILSVTPSTPPPPAADRATALSLSDERPVSDCDRPDNHPQLVAPAAPDYRYAATWSRADGEQLTCVGLTPRLVTARLMQAVKHNGPITVHAVEGPVLAATLSDAHDHLDLQCIDEVTTEDQRERLYVALHGLTCSKTYEEVPLVMAEVVGILLGSPPAALSDAPGERAREVLRNEIINTPETADFMAGVPIEAAHQRERWPSEHDAGKTAFDWFWLVGYLAQKAASAQVAGDTDKALHHTISTAAALANWHAALTGADTSMRPGIEPPDALATAHRDAGGERGAGRG